jgi:hypothetical protein
MAPIESPKADFFAPTKIGTPTESDADKKARLDKEATTASKAKAEAKVEAELEAEVVEVKKGFKSTRRGIHTVCNVAWAPSETKGVDEGIKSIMGESAFKLACKLGHLVEIK